VKSKLMPLHIIPSQQDTMINAGRSCKQMSLLVSSIAMHKHLVPPCPHTLVASACLQADRQRSHNETRKCVQDRIAAAGWEREGEEKERSSQCNLHACGQRKTAPLSPCSPLHPCSPRGATNPQSTLSRLGRPEACIPETAHHTFTITALQFTQESAWQERQQVRSVSPIQRMLRRSPRLAKEYVQAGGVQGVPAALEDRRLLQ